MYHYTSYHRLEIIAAKLFLSNIHTHMHKSRMSTIIFEAAMMKIKHHKNLTQRN